MNAEQLTNPRSNVLTFKRFHLQPIAFDPRKKENSNNNRGTNPHRLSPVPRRPSPVCVSTVHRPWSMVHRQPSIFNLQLSTDCI